MRVKIKNPPSIFSYLTALLKLSAFAGLPIIIFLGQILPTLGHINNRIGSVYIPDDGETNFLTAVSTYRTGALYKDFSIVYPPGRFLIQAGLFHLFYPTAPVSGAYFNTFMALFFPTFLFYLSYKLFNLIFNSKKTPLFKVLNYLLALTTIYISSLIIHSDQEAHVFAALFFWLALSLKKSKFKQLVLGIIIGLVFLFRIDAGILLVISLVFSQASLSIFTLLGSSLVWLPVLLLIIFKGSLQNFFYDIFVLGLLVQPRMMGQAIPPTLKPVFLATLIFLLGGCLALFTESFSIRSKNSKYLTSFCLFSLLSFIAALGRSDEGHLWYGLIWLPPLTIYTLIKILDIKQFFNKKIVLIIPYSLALTFIAKLIIYLKSPLFFIVFSILFFSLIKKYSKLKPVYILWAGIISAVLSFHSLAYLRSRLLQPKLSCNYAISREAFDNKPPKIAGLIFEEADLQKLEKIKSDINATQDDFMFIFPDRVVYYEFFKMKRPTRYFYLTGERTEKTENDIIKDLEATHTKYFLVFPKKAAERGDRTWTWIQANTEILSSYQLGGVQADLRLLKN